MRVARRLLHALLLVLTLVIGAAAAAIIVSQTAWFRDWLRGYVVRQANEYLNGTLSIERLGGNLFFGVELENIGVSMDGSQVVAVKDLGLDYNVFNLITKGLSLDNIRLNHPVLYLRRDGETWSISRLIKKEAQEADRKGPAKPMAIDAIDITDGSVVFEQPVGTSGVDVPKRLDHVDATLSFRYAPVHYSIEISHVSFRGANPAIGVNALSGGVSVKDDTLFVEKLALKTEESSLSVDGAVQDYLTRPVFNLQIRSDKVSLPELAQVFPALSGIRLQPAFELAVGGPSDRLGIDMHVRSTAGQLTGKLTADLAAPGQSVTGDVSVRNLDLAPILNKRSQRSDITADARVDLRGASLTDVKTLHGSVHLNAPNIAAAGYAVQQVRADAKIDGRRIAIDGRAAGYGAHVTAAGRVTLPEGREAAAYDLRGRASRVDLRKLPASLHAPEAATNVNADYHIVGSVPLGPGSARTHADLTFFDSSIAGANIKGGSSASVSVAGRQVDYQADVNVTDVNLQALGAAFGVKALSADRYTSSLNGHVTASGAGTTPADMNLTATGSLVDSSAFGGRIPRMDFDASIAQNSAHVTASGELAGFDPAAVSGKPALKGEAAGTVDVDATLRDISHGVTVDSVDATARVTLAASTIGGVTIDSASVDADYHDAVAEIRTLDVKGRDLNVSATGTLALNDTGQSNLTFHADTPSLAEVGKLLDQPVSGIATTDGTLTGNKRELQASGTLNASDVAYGRTSALTLATSYRATIPELTFEQAKVSADTAATFVTVAGQNLNELHAKTTYDSHRLAFDATAKQPERSMGAAGALVIHPDHQEVHLQQLTLDALNQRWQLAPGSQPAIQYGNNAVAVRQLQLVNGDQTIAADGTFGRPGDELKVSLGSVDLASIDAMLLRPPQFTGSLHASAIVTGTTDQPAVKGDFRIDRGGFRQFRYDTFSGTASYSGRGLDVDTRLQQNPATWLTAKGYVPVALFAGAPETGHRESMPREERIDLHVDSSPIDLGIVQGFTTAVSKVTGTLQATFDVTGSAGDPHPNGAVTLQNGAFTVDRTGVAYTSLNGTIDLLTDRVHIGELKILDNHQQPMSIAGDLAIHELQVGGVNVTVKSHDFKVIDNKMGNVRVNTDLTIEGELGAPRVEGSVGVTTGTIDLDPIVAELGDSAYATKQTEFADPAAPGARQARAEAAAPSLFDSLYMGVHVTVPNDLVIKGNDLQPSGSLVGLGSLNVTLGGDVYAHKAPYDQLRLTGAVNTVRGTYQFQGRRFDILRDGSIRFEGLDELDPTLDIRTQRVIQAVVANVAIRGTLKQPEIVLSSTPPLEQADILSLIVFNQPINQLAEGQQISVAQRAQALATGAAAGAIAQSVGKVLGLDTFEIGVPSGPGGVAQVTVGQQLGQNLYVKLEQGIGDQGQTNFVLEYELLKWLRLRTNVLQGSSTQQQLFQRMQGSGADLLFFFSY